MRKYFGQLGKDFDIFRMIDQVYQGPVKVHVHKDIAVINLKMRKPDPGQLAQGLIIHRQNIPGHDLSFETATFARKAQW